MQNNWKFPDLELCRELTKIWFPNTEYRASRFYLNWKMIFWNSSISPNELLEYVCPSIQELLIQIPFIKDTEFTIERMWENLYFCWLKPLCATPDDTLPNSLSMLIIWLHENKYLTFSTNE